ncbi:DMT family transporter [Atopobium deltae]|uniref:Putative membrane protein n=1 Tax=Atopobium deltae TaxID=1393034 RepID=A0A133XPY3_9ACTN|nr:DMT family transporter [Atopobium deltae]KXB33000.1 putative membrane protein [Atopobium deltae]
MSKTKLYTNDVSANNPEVVKQYTVEQNNAIEQENVAADKPAEPQPADKPAEQENDGAAQVAESHNDSGAKKRLLLKTFRRKKVKAPSSQEVSSRLMHGIIISLIGGACWGLNGTFVKILLDTYHVPELWLVCMRELGAGVLFLATAWGLHRDKMFGILKERADVVSLVWISLTAILFSNVSYVMTISYTNAATATVLQTLSIVVVLFYVCIHNRRRPRRRELIGIVLAITGTYLLATAGDPSRLQIPAWGLFWGASCAISAALLSILPIKLLNKWGSFVVNGYAMLFSGGLLALYVQPWNYMPMLDTFGMTMLVFSVVIGTYGAYALFLQGLSEVGSVRSSMLTTSEPLVAMISSVLLLGTSFLPTDIAGFIMIIVMVYLTA